MKRILVTGATGFIGYEVSRQLAAMDARPRLLIRRPLRGILLTSLKAELMQGDLEAAFHHHPAVLPRPSTCEGSHFTGPVGHAGRPPREFRALTPVSVYAGCSQGG